MPETHHVIGPPGCGKTTYLARQVARAAAKYGHDNVLVCSLTRAGAREAAKRVELPDMQVGTLHSVLYHALGRPDIAEGKTKDWNEAFCTWALMKDSANLDTPYDQPGKSQQLFGQRSGDDLKMMMAKLRTMQIPRNAWPPDVADFAAAWDDWKDQCGFVDFTDLLEQGFDLDAAPGNPAVMALDETQDFGKLEMALVIRWAKALEHLVLVGDGHQNLYAFRGSDPYIMFQEGVTPHVLDQSYRVPRAVLPVAMKWMSRTGLPQVQYRARDYDGSVTRGGVYYKQPDALVPLVERHLARDKEVMLMTTCQYHLEPILRTLREHGIAYHNPWRRNHGRWNPLAPRRGLTFSDRVLAFLRPVPAVWDERSRFWTPDDLKAWAKALPAAGVFRPRQKTQVERFTGTDEELARALELWFEPEALAHILALDAGWYSALASGGALSKAFVENIVQRRGPRALRETPRVIVGTCHSLKGSEADVVMVWPDIAPRAYYGTETVKQELARVFYVAVTRTKEDLILMPPSSHVAVGW